VCFYAGDSVEDLEKHTQLEFKMLETCCETLDKSNRCFQSANNGRLHGVAFYRLQQINSAKSRQCRWRCFICARRPGSGHWALVSRHGFTDHTRTNTLRHYIKPAQRHTQTNKYTYRERGRERQCVSVRVCKVAGVFNAVSDDLSLLLLLLLLSTYSGDQHQLMAS